MEKLMTMLLVFIDIHLLIAIICFIKLDISEYRDIKTNRRLNEEIGTYIFIPILNICLLIFLLKIKFRPNEKIK